MHLSNRTVKMLAVVAASSVFSLTAFIIPSVRGQAGPAEAPPAAGSRAGGGGAAGTAGGAPAAAAAAGATPQADMRAMSTALNGIRGNVTDAAKNAATLELVATLQKESMEAKQTVPPTIAALPEAERPARIAEYKKEMNKLIRQELDLEDQLLSGDNTKAGETITAIQATQAEGHRGFRAQRGGGGAGRGGAGRGPGGAGGAGAPPAPPAQ